jgi:flagellar basal-body rod modification protein FlgD
MTSPINSTGAAPTVSATTAAAAAAPQTMGKDAFLKLLMAQLKNQDPLNPSDSTQFVTQLSQFSLVEQSVQQSSELTSISTALQGLNNQNSLALVGQSVTVNGGNLNFSGNFAVSGQATLAAPATAVTATVVDPNGNPVRTMKLGAHGQGPVSVTWDGRGDNGQLEPAGTYSLAVSATDASGQSVTATQSVKGIVAGVSIGGTNPTLTLTNGMVMPVSNLVSVGTTLNNP